MSEETDGKENSFEKLKEQLDLQEWPNVFLFKFIIPNDSETLAKTTALFEDTADIVMHPSRNDKYVSVSGKEMMLDTESIIDKYSRAIQIKGLIAL